MVVAAIVLACLISAAIACVVHPRLVLLAGVGALDVIWLLTNSPIEGPVLLSLTKYHGLTVADLAVLVTVPAAWSYVMSSVRRRNRADESAALDRR